MHPMAHTNSQTHRQTDGYCDSKTELVQWADLVKIIYVLLTTYIFNNHFGSFNITLLIAVGIVVASTHSSFLAQFHTFFHNKIITNGFVWSNDYKITYLR